VLTIVIGAGVIVASSTDWRQFAPLWYLRHEAKSNDPKPRDAALVELNNRVTAGVLSQAQIDTLADDALAVQADVNKPWAEGWGDVFENGWAAGKISTQRLQRYVETALPAALNLQVRPEISRGDRLYYWTRSGPARVGSRRTFYVSTTMTSLDIGPLHMNGSGGGSGGMLNARGGGGTGTAVYFKPEEAQQIPDGNNTIVMHLDVKIAPNWNAAPLHTVKFDLRDRFIMRPAGESTVKLVHDPSMRPAMEKGITCRELQFGRWGQNQLNVSISVDKIPAGVGYDVYAKIAGKDQKVGSFARPGKNGPNVSGGFSFGNQVPPFDGTKLDVILKPSVDAALGTTDTFEIWDEPIVIKDVPVIRATPASNAASKPATKASAK